MHYALFRYKGRINLDVFYDMAYALGTVDWGQWPEI